VTENSPSANTRSVLRKQDTARAAAQSDRGVVRRLLYKLGKRLGVTNPPLRQDCGWESFPAMSWVPKRRVDPEQPVEAQALRRPLAAGGDDLDLHRQSFVLVTPLQMARLISAYFNGGYLYQPKVVKWVGKDDKQVYQFTPEVTAA